MTERFELADRVKELRRVRAGDIDNAPWNYREHPKGQNDALLGSFADLGFFKLLLTWEQLNGRLMLIDGEARKNLLSAEVHEDWLVPCVVTDLNEAEAKLALAVCDPLSALNANTLEGLLNDIGGAETDALDGLLDQLAHQHGIVPPDFSPVSFDEQGKLNERKKHECPKCGERF